MCKRLGVLCQSTASQNNKAATRYIVGKGCIQYCVLAVWFFFLCDFLCVILLFMSFCVPGLVKRVEITGHKITGYKRHLY